MTLNPNQQRFIVAYRSTCPRNATRAYAQVYRAKGESACVNASRLLRNAQVQAAIAEADAADLRDLGITPARVLAEIARLGFSDLRQFYQAYGTLKPVHTLDADLAAAVSAVEVVETFTEDGVLQRTKKLRLWNKPENLKTLAQYLKLLVDKVEIEVNGEVALTWSDRLSRAHAALEERRRHGQAILPPEADR